MESFGKAVDNDGKNDFTEDGVWVGVMTIVAEGSILGLKLGFEDCASDGGRLSLFVGEEGNTSDGFNKEFIEVLTEGIKETAWLGLVVNSTVGLNEGSYVVISILWSLGDKEGREGFTFRNFIKIKVAIEKAPWRKLKSFFRNGKKEAMGMRTYDAY